MKDCICHTLEQGYCSPAYIDDIMVYSASWEGHYHHLLVLQRLLDGGLTLTPSKCEWGIASCSYIELWAKASAVLRTARCECSLLPPSAPDQGSGIVILGSQVTIVILYPDFPHTPTTLLSLLKSQHQRRPPELMTFNENFNDCLCSTPCLSFTSHLTPFVYKQMPQVW